jgi:hypothetical protein
LCSEWHMPVIIAQHGFSGTLVCIKQLSLYFVRYGVAQRTSIW